LEDSELLLIPGPVSVTQEVLDALSKPVRAHYGDEWTALYKKLTTEMQGIFRTSGDVFLVFGPGSAGIEMSLASTLGPGDEVLVPGGGFFADRVAELSRAIGLQVHELRPDGYRPLAPEAVERALRQHPNTRAVALVHHETDLGLINPVREITEVTRAHDALMVLDAISSLGGIELDMDGWGVDLCVAVGNKVLGAPVGVAPVAVGARAWRAVADGRPKTAGWYLNLETWRRYVELLGDWHPHPTTMPTNVMVAFDAALDQFLAEGQEARMQRLAAAAARVRDGLRELGFEMLVDDDAASPVYTAVLGLPGMDVRRFIRWLHEERGLHVSGGLGPLSGRIFRVGHMGAGADPAVVDRFLEAAGEYVEKADGR
jgi:alanine-glyoxylate transaminase/serine-glyoxylate transaminase/serine-pyruvate transaminase